MEEKILQEVLRQAPFGYAYHKMVFSAEGLPVDYIFLEVNPAFEEMTGLRKENIIGKKVTESIPDIKKDQFDWINFYGQIAANGGREEFTQYSGPLRRWYKVTAFSWQQGYFATYIQEITAQMERIKILEKQQETIAELNLELEKVFNGTNDAMFLIKVENGQFRYIRNNKTHQKLTGFFLEMIKDKTPAELVGEELGRVIEANYRRCLESGETITYEETLNLPAGERVWLTSLTPVIEKDRVKYIVGSSKDITLQKKNEERLQQLYVYEKILSEVSRLALEKNGPETFLSELLKIIGKNLNVSRSYFFERNPFNESMSNTFEWTAPGISPQLENLQGLPEAEFDWFVANLKNCGVLICGDINEIPDEKTREKLREQDIKSLLAVPIYLEKEYCGFIGLDDCLTSREWTEGEVNLLLATSELISKYLLLNKKEKALWEENQRFRAMVNSTDDVIYQLDKEERHVAVYGRWLEKAGLKPEVFLGKRARDLFGPERAKIHEEANNRALSGQNVVYDWYVEENGSRRYYQTSLAPIKNPNGEVSGIFGVGRDITELMLVKEELQKERELLYTTLQSIGDGVVATDQKGRITSMNKVAEEITGWKQEEAKNKPFAQIFRLVSEETGKKVQNPVEKVLQTGKIIGLANHTALIAKDGRRVPIADSAAPIKDEQGQTFGVVMVFRDVTQEKDWQDKILYLSYHDTLTGLYNRRFMEEELKRQELNGKLPLAVIMADVNGLKLANDVFGHAEGDKLLKKAAEAIKKCCRKDDLVSRWGGDEFLIFLPQTSAQAAEEITKRIKSATQAYGTEHLRLSIALGCATKETAGEKLEEVVKEAEERMYRQKLNEGKSFRNSIVNTLLATLYAKSSETEEHAGRLKDFCLKIGTMLKLTSKEMDELSLLAVLHDIGKVGIREEILKKPGSLTELEWEEMKKHPEIGCRIAQNTPELGPIVEHILCHHERWDGQGYPQGLKGEEIPLLCRILAVADAYDAMTSDRPYRKALSREEAIEEIKRNAGTQFDPQIVEMFLESIKSINKKGDERNGVY